MVVGFLSPSLTETDALDYLLSSAFRSRCQNNTNAENVCILYK